MQSDPKISVLIPTHDRPKFLKEAIQSVISNGWDSFEVVVSDDSSNGSAREVVEAFQDPRLRWFGYQEGGGKSANWSHAARQAKSEILFKLDDDDYILPGFLKRVITAFDEYPEAASVYTAYVLEDDQTKHQQAVVDKDFFVGRKIVDGGEYAKAVLICEGGYPVNQKTSVVYRRHAADKISYYDIASEDFVFSAVLGWCGKVVYLPDPLYVWRQHEANGIRDLYRTWELSREALLRVERSSLPECISGDGLLWSQVCRRSIKALPAFYCQAEFRDRGLIAAWGLWFRIKRQGALPSVFRSLMWMIPMSLFPPFVHQKLFCLFRNFPLLQRVIRRWV